MATDPDSYVEGCPEGRKPCLERLEDGSSGELTCVAKSDVEYGCGRTECAPCQPSNAVALCTSDGECGVASCRGSFEDCDGDPSNGCEVNIDNDVDHCGGCNDSCGEVEGGEAACGAAACYVRDCIGQREDCDGDFRTGCEVDLSSDDGHCGECDNRCEVGTTCQDGTCV